MEKEPWCTGGNRFLLVCGIREYASAAIAKEVQHNSRGFNRLPAAVKRSEVVEVISILCSGCISV